MLLPDGVVRAIYKNIEEHWMNHHKNKYNDVMKQFNFFVKDDWGESGWADYEGEDPVSMYEYFCGELDGWRIYVWED